MEIHDERMIRWLLRARKAGEASVPTTEETSPEAPHAKAMIWARRLEAAAMAELPPPDPKVPPVEAIHTVAAASIGLMHAGEALVQLGIASLAAGCSPGMTYESAADAVKDILREASRRNERRMGAIISAAKDRAEA